MHLGLIIFLTIFLSLSFHANAQDAKQALNDKLYEATRTGNIVEVKALLDQGADVNAKFRYGTTALFKAAERGYAEVVKLLLERGADVSVKDTFYNATAMTWALQNKHVEVVGLLLEKDPASVDDVLTTGVRDGNVALVRIALAKGGSKPEKLGDALVLATSGPTANIEIADLLRKAGAELPKQLPPEVMQSYVGNYKNESGTEVSFVLKDNVLVGSTAGQPPLTWSPVDNITFRPVGFDGLTITFNVEASKVTGLTLKQGPNTTQFKRIEAAR